MNRRPPPTNQQGFTLIEIIITFTVAAAMLAMVIPYMNTRQTNTDSPTAKFQATLATLKAMENITADYNLRLEAGEANLLATMTTAIGAVGSNQNNSYGAYRVVANGYIQFTAVNTTDRSEAAATAATANNALKVTIGDPGNTGVQYTTLFTQF